MTGPSLAMSPETVDWVDRSPPDIQSIRLGDDVFPIASFTFSFESPPCRSWSTPGLGVREITGHITAMWNDGDLAGWRPNALVMARRVFLKIVRSTMTKRRFRRWRNERPSPA